jgi:HSP20 family protein
MNVRNDEVKARYRVPSCAIAAEEDLALVQVEMPGVPKDGLEIKIEGNELTIIGKRRMEDFDGEYILRERGADPYRKILTLDDSIDRDRVEAELKDGVLHLKLHVKEAAKPKRIPIA